MVLLKFEMSTLLETDLSGERKSNFLYNLLSKRPSCTGILPVIAIVFIGIGNGDGKDLRLEVIINGSVVCHLACNQGRPGQLLMALFFSFY